MMCFTLCNVDVASCSSIERYASAVHAMINVLYSWSTSLISLKIDEL